MRVAIDARKLHDFGVGTYIRNLLRHLARLDADSEYVLLCRQADLGVAAELGPNFRTVLEPSPNYSIREQLHVPWVLMRERPDVFHSPHYVLPPAIRCRSVVTIHDTIHLTLPQYLPNRMAYVYAKASMWAAARRSDRILTVSEASKRDIVRLLDVRADKVVVVYNAIDERFWLEPAQDDVDRVRERFQLDGRFILYVGNIKPHKNLVRLIEAFHELRRGDLEALKLVIIGDEISKFPALRRAVHQYKLHKHVRFLGYLPDATLAVLYRLAAVFAFPSLYEGFGLPPLEAMASGTPVVTSNVSSLPEVAGDAAVLVDPYDTGSIVDGLRRVLTDPALAAELRCKGLARARAFSWEQSVAKTCDLYHEIAGRPKTAAASVAALGAPQEEPRDWRPTIK
jgi:glycosyltransferase involved in cell wall biosynthesis